jgi:hypothetical protein
MSVPGNAYVSQTGGNFTAPASPAAVALTAATAKTVLTLTVGTNNQPAITELGVSCDGASGTLLIELGLLTAATAGTGTASLAPQQVRGWPPSPSQLTYGFNYTVEPTAYTVIARQWLVPMPMGPLVMQFPLGREPTGIITAATAGKIIGVRLTSSIGANARVLVEHEMS